MPVRYTTASRSVLDGIVPVLMQTPPSIRPRSTTATVLPSLAAAIAAFCPPGPEPMTTRSYSCIEPMDRDVRRFGQSCMLTTSIAREQELGNGANLRPRAPEQYVGAAMRR